MAIIRGRSRRKPSGGRYKRVIEIKRKYKLARSSILTKLGSRKESTHRSRGGASKHGLFYENKINVFNPKTKKYLIANITTIVENPANRHFVRRNIMTKGTVVQTDNGKVLITSRPGQESRLNGILLEQ